MIERWKGHFRCRNQGVPVRVDYRYPDLPRVFPVRYLVQ